MAQFTIYRSSDAGAPVLNGLSGSLITVLDAILVNGYGTQPSASWTKPYSTTGSLYAAYQQGSGSSRCYLWVRDSGSVASGQEAIIRGCENLTSIFGITGSNVNAFPTAIQSVLTSNGLVVRKSATVTSTARAWVATADSRTLYFFAQTGDVANTYFSFAFGDIYSYVPNDPYRCMIMARNGENANTIVANEGFYYVNGASPAATQGGYLQRSFYGANNSYNFGKHVDSARNAIATTFAGSTDVLPNPADGKIYLSKVWITDYNSTLRGHMRGLYNLSHNIASVSNDDVFSGSIDSTDRTFMVVKLPGYIIETSNTLDTN